MKIIITESQYKNLINESTFVFPIGNDNFNVGYDSQGLGRGVSPKVLDREDAIHNSDYSGKHLGIDIFAPKGTPLVSCVDGEVYEVNWGEPVGGNVVNIKGDDGKNYRYAHLDNINNELEKGDRITKGKFLGTVGKTGNAINTHPHLHFSVYNRNYFSGSIDPWPYLNATLDQGDIIVIDNDDVADKIDGTVVTGDVYIADILDNNDNSELISMGSKGEGVVEIQEILLSLDYELPKYGADGRFGRETKKAVEEFQREKGLTPTDGIVGIETSKEMYEYV